MPEHHAKNVRPLSGRIRRQLTLCVQVPRGNKTTLRDPDSCEEAQGSFRTSLESTTASSRLEGFTASSGSEKAQRHYVEQTVGQNEVGNVLWNQLSYISEEL